MGCWEYFSASVEMHADLQHAEQVLQSDLTKPDSNSFYLPMHEVIGEASTVIKLRWYSMLRQRHLLEITLLTSLFKDWSHTLYSHLSSSSLDNTLVCHQASVKFGEFSVHSFYCDLHRFLKSMLLPTNFKTGECQWLHLEKYALHFWLPKSWAM